MGRIVLSIVLGLFAWFAVFMAGEAVEVPGQNPPQEMIAAALAAFLYLAICQFLVAPRGSRGLRERWPTAVAMGAALLAGSLILLAGRTAWQYVVAALPVVAPGLLGIAAGSVLAARVTLSRLPLASCRRNARLCAVLLAGVSVVLVGAMVPLLRNAGVHPDGAPGAMGTASLVFALLSALVAADLALIAARPKRGRRPSPVALGYLALLAFVPACFLAIPAIWFTGHGPLLRVVSVLSPLCALAEFAVMALLGATALRLPGGETT